MSDANLALNAGALTPAVKHQDHQLFAQLEERLVLPAPETCPSKSIPAHEIERFVVDRIKCIGRDPALLQEVIVQANSQAQIELPGLEAERRSLERDLKTWHAEVHKLAAQVGAGETETPGVAQLADLHERIGGAERRATEVREHIVVLQQGMIGQRDVAFVLARFEPVWEALSPREQARMMELLVERVEYDGAKGKVSITFHSAGIKTLAAEMVTEQKGRSA